MSSEELKGTEQSLIDHLSELRTRIVHCFIIILIGVGIAWGFSEKIFDVVRKPILPYLPNGLVYTGLLDKFMAHIKVSFLAGIILTSPLWLYQLWKFISPGLYDKEKKAATLFIVAGTFFFLCGVSFAYFVMFPFSFKFLMNFAGNTDTPMITINEYLSFVMTTSLAFGAVFEIPLILTVLSIIGLIDKALLVKSRRFAIVGMAVLSAILTPPDVVSMTAMLIPLIVLYEISVISVGIFGVKKKRWGSSEEAEA